MREMKDSGVEWIGNIPKNWSILKLKYVLKFSGSGTTPYSNKLEFYDGDIEWIQSGDLYHTNTIVNTKVKLKSLALKYCPALKFYKAPFIVIAMYGASVGNASISCINACTNQACCVLYPNNENNLKFLYYWIVIAKNELLKKSIGGGQPNINQITIKNLNFINLPYKNQQAIADFLDAKCADIDSLTEDIQKQIDILKEYKKSVITQAVTKGIAPNVEMKDSGIAWIGLIPESWRIFRLKYLLAKPLQYGASETGIEFTKDLPRYIRITDIDENNHLKESGKLSLSFEKAKPYILKDNCVLFARSGATVGKTFFYKRSYGLAAFAGYLIAAFTKSTLLCANWLYYYTQSNTYWNWVRQIFNQSTIQNIGADKYNNLPVTVPTLKEQQDIVDYLDAKCADIDAAIAGKQKQLDVLKEYKKSLIYEYVTGKKEVPCREYDPS